MIDIIIEVIVDKLLEKILDRVDESLLSSLAEKSFLESWYKVFEKAIYYSNVFAPEFGKELSSHRTLMRYYYATFDPTLKVPTVDDLAISIGMEFHDFQLRIQPEIIIGLADAVVKNWAKELTENKKIRKKIEVSGKPIPECKYELSKNELIEILSDKQKLYRRFFQSYEHDCGVRTIRVWYPSSGETWIEWRKEDSIDISVNPMLGMELGFFRVGYDYSLIYNDKDESLKYASISMWKSRETGEFKSMVIGDKSGEVFWAK